MDYGVAQLTPFTTGRDNRSVPPLYTAAETRASCGGSAKARSFQKSPAGLGVSARWLDTQVAIEAVEAAMRESLTP